MFFSLTVFIGAAFARAHDLDSTPTSPEVYCAALLATAAESSATERSAAHAALGHVVGRPQRLSEDAATRPEWTRDLRRAVRQFWRASGPARVRLPGGAGGLTARPRFERLVDAAVDRLRDARHEQSYGNPDAFPLQRVVVGAPAIRAYFAGVAARAALAQAEVDARADAAARARPRLYPRKFIGTGAVTGALLGAGWVGWWMTSLALRHHHPHAAIALATGFTILLAGQLPPRVLRLSLSVRDGFDVVTGRANRARPRGDARFARRLARQITALAEDPRTPADVLVVAGWTSPLPLRHIETDRLIGSPAARRAAPSPEQILEAMAERGQAVLPVDPRAIAQELAFFKNERGEPTLLVLGREPKYAYDHR